ncbi:MAG: hypothetical protein EOP84_16885 [Verrucomicrobiaceae bacterium]|nr:MAG: hypothetical protein EOP84_16885 [Verrucomicrobiaceae bacterium]
MKTFEERYTAWMNDQLTGPELEAFEKELDQRPVPAGMESERESRLLGDLLRTHLAAPALTRDQVFKRLAVPGAAD